MRWLVVTVGLVSILGCMCGSGEPTTVETTPTSTSATAAPASAARTGGWSASIEGVCQMESDCGCLEKGTVDACVASLRRNDAVFTSSVLSCIVTQNCAEMCGGGGSSCVQAGAQAQMGAEAARHQMMNGIINNYPSGGNCPSGQTEVVDAQGRFVRCR